MMIKEVYPQIFVNEIPLPRNPLRVINSYVIMSEQKNLIIDTGFNTAECQAELMKGLEELGVDLTKTDLFNTHMHTDHSGLTPVLKQKGVKTVYFSQRDGELYNNVSRKESFSQTILSLNQVYGLTSQNPFGKDFGKAPEPLDFTPLAEGNEIRIGDYCLEVVEIPGHTPGHLGLYERKHKFFFCGDHILDGISPNITFWGFEQDMLAIYMDSLKKVYAYDIDYLFTGHRQTIKNHRQRINEILEHHKERLDEVRGILKGGSKTIGELAPLMNWDVGNKKWEELPSAQKWFASGEAASHVEYLVCAGLVGRNESNGQIFYELL